MYVFLRRWFTQESSGIAASALLVSVASLASRLLGVVRDRLLAGHFGAGVELDAYYAAFRVPDTLFNLFIAGALSAGFIPLFSEYLEQRSEGEAWKLASQVLTTLTALMTIVSGLFVILAPWIVPLFTHGFSSEGVALTITMTRIMAISPLLLGISGVMGGILQVKKRFAAFAVAPLFYNLGIILGILGFAREWGIVGVAIGVALGSFAHACVQGWPALQLGLRPALARPWWSEGVRRLFWMMIPRTASLAVTQVNLIIILALASSLSVGSVAIFTLATNIQSLPFGLIGVSIAVAAFPVLSQAANQGAGKSFQRILSQQIAWMLFLLMPLTVLFYLLAPEIVTVVLGAGKFDAVTRLQTAEVLQLLVIALPAQSLVALFVRAYYAKQNTWTPFFISLGAEGINLILCLSLRSSYGLRGLAIAFTVSTVVNIVGLWLALSKESIPVGEDRRSLLKTIFGSGLATLIMMIVGEFARGFFVLEQGNSLAIFAKSSFFGLLLVGVYLLATILLRLPETTRLLMKIRKVLQSK